METGQVERLNAQKKTVDNPRKGLPVFGDQSIFPLLTLQQVAVLFNVRPATVKEWVRKKLLKAHYQLLSGRSCRMVFTNRELVRFFEENFPSVEDLSGDPSNPRRGSKAARLIEKMFAMNRLYLRRRRRAE